MLSVKGDSRAQGSRLPRRANIISILHQNLRFIPTIAGSCLAILRPLTATPSRQYGITCVAILRSRTGEGWHVKIADDTGRTLVIVLFPAVWRRAYGPHRASG